MARHDPSRDPKAKAGALTAPQRRLQPDAHQPGRILVIEDDRELADLLADHLAETLRAEVSIARTCHEAVDIELSRPQDLILADVMLPDGDAMGLMRQLQGITSAGFVLMTGAPTVGRAVEALRLGAMDFLSKPFELSQVTEAVRTALARKQQQANMQVRYMRMRRLAKRIIQDRRELRQRVDLVCRDLVQAYRRLARRVVELYELYGYEQEN